MENTITKKVVVSGRVQGVFYRAYTQKAANGLKVKGYVKNLPNGSVEAVFQGTVDQVDQMVAWCNQGSPSSSVTRVDECTITDSENYSNFDITF